MISETTFTVRGHGVHTAFKEMTAGLQARQDVLVRVNSFKPADVTHIQTIGFYSLMALLFGRGAKVISVHVIPDSFTGSLRGANYWYNLSSKYLRFFYGRADRLLAVSQEVADKLISQLQLDPAKIEVVFNTVNTANYHTSPEAKAAARKQLGIASNQTLIIGCGQVQPRKRYDVFISLAKEFPDHRFIWVGGIPFKHLAADYDKMNQLIATSPANMTTTGVIELEQVKQYYQAADIFILPSDQENHPMAVIEAAASGLPIIVRDIPNYDSSFGGNVLRGQDDTFANIIDKLVTNPAYRQEAIKGAGVVAAKFDNKTGAERLMQIYRTTLDSVRASESV